MINLAQTYKAMEKYLLAIKLFNEVHTRDEKNLAAIEGIANIYITLDMPLEGISINLLASDIFNPKYNFNMIYIQNKSSLTRMFK